MAQLTINHDVEDVEACKNRGRSGAYEPMSEENGEEDTESGARAQVNGTVRSNIKCSRDHLCTEVA